jgi:hypothetical protein
MTQTTAEAQRELLDAVAEATDHLGMALASLGAAFEQLDEAHGAAVEEKLFRPVQLAYGRARRTHSRYADSHGLPSRKFEAPSPGLASIGARTFIDNAAVEVGQAETTLTTLQDSMLPVEVGDPELRASLAEVRDLIGSFSASVRGVTGSIGR